MNPRFWNTAGLVVYNLEGGEHGNWSPPPLRISRLGFEGR